MTYNIQGEDKYIQILNHKP